MPEDGYDMVMLVAAMYHGHNWQILEMGISSHQSRKTILRTVQLVFMLIIPYCCLQEQLCGLCLWF